MSVWRCGVCEGELSAQVGCISREGEVCGGVWRCGV